MWEESCESISVRHRRASEVHTREDGASASDSEEEFVLIPEAGQYLLIHFYPLYDHHTAIKF